MWSTSKCKFKLILLFGTIMHFEWKYLFAKVFGCHTFKLQYCTMIKAIIISLLILGACSTLYKISQQFFTNSFTNNDLLPWTITPATTSLIKFTTCGSNRIFGGYNIFIGDPTTPTQITRQWLNIIPHYSLTITAKIYKVDSWPNNTLFAMVDGTTVALFTFNNSNTGTADICGNPNPITDSINTNYNQNIQQLNITIPHSSSSLTLTFISNLMGSTGSWGFRDLNITMQACDQSCNSCTNGSACLSCNTSNGLILSGAFCMCLNSSLKRQKKIPCLVAPCAVCAPLSCLAGYYPSAITTYCEPCNIACSLCNDPTNSLTSCTACSTSFVGNPSSGVICASCFSGCATCISTSSFACTSCTYQYFYYSLNNSCLSSCPLGFYGQQKTSTCYACVTPCVNCIGSGVVGYFCTSCIIGSYLWNNTCSSSCPINTYAYNSICYSVCPITTFANTSSYVCTPCSSNCAQCTLTTICNQCISNAYLLLGVCYTSCPLLYYPNTTTGLCFNCDSSCQTCSGSAYNQCLSCATGLVLLNSICYSSCPVNTYSNLCLPCDTTCLTCAGPRATDCLSCASPNFYHQNFTSCLSTCNKGQISNNYNMSCYVCVAGEVAYFQVCTLCHSTCLSCNGISFLQCLSCDNKKSILEYSTCVTKYDSRVIYSPNMVSTTLTPTIQTLLIIYLCLCIFLQLIFEYKTNLLLMIQTLQILSYTYYLSFPLSENTQLTTLFLHISNISWIFRPLQTVPSASLTTKFALIGKTGSYFVDSLGLNIIMLSVIIMHLGVKHFSKRYKIVNSIYKKINPYLISYTFKLLFLEIAMNAVIYLYSFSIDSTLGILSLTLLLIDFITILLGILCWKVVTQFDGQQTALLYNNEIGDSLKNKNLSSYEQDQKQQSQIQAKIKKSQVLPSVLGICSKMPIPLTILLFIGNSNTQVICLAVYFALNLGMSAIIPYRRRIYRVTIIMNGIFVFVSYLVCIGVMRGASSYYLQLVWLLLIISSLFVTIMQILVNYRYFCQFFAYSWHNFAKIVFSEQEQKKNDQSQSNLTADNPIQDQQVHKQNIFKKEKSCKTNVQFQSKDKEAQSGKIKPNKFSSYVTQTNYNSENDIKLDLNL